MARTQAQIDADLDTALAGLATAQSDITALQTALASANTKLLNARQRVADLEDGLAKAVKMVKKLAGRLGSSGGGAAQVKTILVRGKVVRRLVAAPANSEASPRGKTAATRIIRARHN